MFNKRRDISKKRSGASHKGIEVSAMAADYESQGIESKPKL